MSSPLHRTTSDHASHRVPSRRLPSRRLMCVVAATVALPVFTVGANVSADDTPTTSVLAAPTATPPTTTPVTTSSVTVPPATTPPVTVPPVTVPHGTGPIATVPPVTTPTDATPPTVTQQPVIPTPPPSTPSGPVAPPARNITVFPAQMEHVLATIRYLESRGNYTIAPNKGGASGAYQFVTGTWNNYGGYPQAYLAPTWVQDERAAKDVQAILDRYGNDVSMVPVIWYYPIAARQPELMDQVPRPENGNKLTIREYQTRWLGIFASMSGQTIRPRAGAPVDLSAFAGFAPVLPASHDGVPSLSYPVLGPSRLAVPECDSAIEPDAAAATDGDTATGPSRADVEAAGLCTEQAPGIVFGVKLQPILAVADGVVTDVRDQPGSGLPITVTITDAAGTSYVYAGFNDDNPGTDDGAAPAHLRLSGLARVGTTVRAGQIIGFMGDTDPIPVGVRADVPTDSTITLDPDAVAPHIRITMVGLDGRPIDSFGPVIDALFRQTCRVMIGQWSVPANGSGHERVTTETTDDDDEIDSEWVVTETGTVTAAGWGALVNPSEGCSYAPSRAFGPSAGGDGTWLSHWSTPIVLPTDVWISLAFQDETDVAGLFHR